MYRIKPYNYSVKTKDVFDLFDDFFNTPVNYVRNFRVDIEDLKDKYVVSAELPGLTKEDISIKYENEQLTISVNKEEDTEEKKEFVYRERVALKSERSFFLKDVDPTKLSAKFENGVLVIELSKLEHKINSYMIDID